MAASTRLLTADDLWRMPTDEPWELRDGELLAIPGAGGAASALAGWISVLVGTFVRPRRLGMVTGADGTYILRHDPYTVVIPDVAFVSWDRLPGRVPPTWYIPVPPDFAVEIRSLSDKPRRIAKKLGLYRQAGVPLVWWVDPARRTVAVYREGHLAAELGEGDVLAGEDVLPGFRVPVAEIFAEA